ncbi:hypothetical protein AUO95_01295 [Corynebacterium glutamicum]|nr:hypothetical protein AUO95_01295 [Corynebacterium glutamicum]
MNHLSLEFFPFPTPLRSRINEFNHWPAINFSSFQSWISTILFKIMVARFFIKPSPKGHQTCSFMRFTSNVRETSHLAGNYPAFLCKTLQSGMNMQLVSVEMFFKKSTTIARKHTD